MEITTEVKDRVIECLYNERERRGVTWTKFASIVSERNAVRFNKSAFSQINKPKRLRNYRVVKDSTWLTLARYYNILEARSWNTAKTKAYITVQAHLEKCREYGIWQMLCDRAGIGKSYAAREFAQKNKNVFYIDCSEYNTKTDFIVFLAQQFGLDATSRNISRLWRETINELLVLDKPLLILDEFGDCSDKVITLMKSLYNRANMGDYMALGCYFIGADNLEQKLIDGRMRKKPSYAEFWSRVNKRVTRQNYGATVDDFMKELKNSTEAIVDANLTEELKDKRNTIIEKSLVTGGVRSIQNEIAIMKMLKNEQAD